MKKLNQVSDSQWEEVNEFNREIVEEFLSQQHLSPQTLKQYRSALRQFFYWVKEKCNDKPLYELKARDALKFQNYLLDHELSSSAVKFKRSAVSSICNFLEVYYDDEYPSFRNIFSKKIPSVADNKRYEKNPLTEDELEFLITELEKKEEWQMLAYLVFSYETGCRRAEAQQIKKEVVDYDYYKDKNYYVTHMIRGKGRGREGEKIKLIFGDESKKYIKKWLEHRGEDNCEYVFVKKYKDGSVKPVSLETFNYWCSDVFSKILNRRVYPHLLRSTRATHLNNQKRPIKAIQKLLWHKSSNTTEIYIVDDEDELIDDIFE